VNLLEAISKQEQEPHMSRPTSTTKKTVKRENAKQRKQGKQLGFDEPIPMVAPQGGYLGVVGMLNIYNRLTAEMRECNAGPEGLTDPDRSSDIAYFNY
jgi:hypothetical protein